MSPENSPFQDYRTRNVGPQICILQLNIEGISRAKTEYLIKLLSIHKIDVILLEETHDSNKEQLRAGGHISGFLLADATYDRMYGSATYLRETILDWQPTNTLVTHDISIITTKVAGINIQNIYKQQNVRWPTNTPTTLAHSTVFMGDFNSRHQSWCYSDNDENGEKIYERSS
jgi:exonuclease III